MAAILLTGLIKECGNRVELFGHTSDWRGSRAIGGVDQVSLKVSYIWKCVYFGVGDMGKILKWIFMTQNLFSCQRGGVVGSDLQEVWAVGGSQRLSTVDRGEGWIRVCMWSGKRCSLLKEENEGAWKIISREGKMWSDQTWLSDLKRPGS